MNEGLMSILYVAYSCSPVNGSEDRVGWNICIEAAKRNKVYVLTKEEHRKSIETYLCENQVENICFFYVDIPNIYKKLFKGFLYSARLNIWHDRALSVARGICEEHSIDIIHQITPVEFRAIGDYGSIKKVKFVCGPLGGGEAVPNGLWGYTKGHRMTELIRMLANYYRRFRYCIDGRLRRCSYLMYANNETKDFVGIGNHVESELAVDEVPLSSKNIGSDGKCTFLVAGRMIYRKGHALLFDALEMVNTDKDYEIKILGAGPDLYELKRRCERSEVVRGHVSFLGRVPFQEMTTCFQNADVLILSSIRETTGSIMFEAMQNGLPIIGMNRFGSGILLNDSIGWVFGGETKEDFVQSLGEAIRTCVENPQERDNKRRNIQKEAEKHTWEKKMGHFMQVYRKLVQDM